MFDFGANGRIYTSLIQRRLLSVCMKSAYSSVKYGEGLQFQKVADIKYKRTPKRRRHYTVKGWYYCIIETCMQGLLLDLAHTRFKIHNANAFGAKGSMSTEQQRLRRMHFLCAAGKSHWLNGEV